MMGTKGMVSVTPISEYKGCFFVDSARRAMWFQDQGSLTVRGGVVALRRWSPKENSVVGGKFRREMGEGNEGGKGNSEARRLVEGKDVGGDASKCRATSVARGGRWSLVIYGCSFRYRRAEEDVLLRPESNRSKDEVTSAEGCVYQRPKNVEGLRATARDNEYHRWRPRHRSRARSSVSNSATKVEKGRGKSCLGPTAGSVDGPTKPEAFFKGRFARAHFEEKNIGPFAGPVHETEAGSSNGGPATPSSSKLQRSGTSAKEMMPIAHSQESAKLKGNSVTARCKARSWPPSLKVTSLAPMRNLDGDGAPEANRGFIWGRSVFKKGALSPVSEKSRHFTEGTEGDEGISPCNWVKKVRPPSLALSEKDLPLGGAFNPNILSDSSISSILPSRCQAFSPIPLESSLVSQRSPFPKFVVVEPSPPVGVSRYEGVAFPLETSNRNSEDWPLCKDSLSSPEKLCVSGKASSQTQNLPSSCWKVFRLRDSRLEKWSRLSRFGEFEDQNCQRKWKRCGRRKPE
ncbi:hypothetical protein CK203_029193 [Vitis vinifera]|uniref:DUF4283 domain-containing protein n=1 Tax=Vitis vinifera TaxID=29760 RepID=A0A438IT09_VITVI|nr:hypothetical protein CK203_029193 [Vitis vinifera]